MTLPSSLGLVLLVADVAVLVSVERAEAQVPYVVMHRAGIYTPFDDGLVHVPESYGPWPAWDEGSAAIPLPFAFR